MIWTPKDQPCKKHLSNMEREAAYRAMCIRNVEVLPVKKQKLRGTLGSSLEVKVVKFYSRVLIDDTYKQILHQ